VVFLDGGDLLKPEALKIYNRGSETASTVLILSNMQFFQTDVLRGDLLDLSRIEVAASGLVPETDRSFASSARAHRGRSQTKQSGCALAEL